MPYKQDCAVRSCVTVALVGAVKPCNPQGSQGLTGQRSQDLSQTSSPNTLLRSVSMTCFDTCSCWLSAPAIVGFPEPSTAVLVLLLAGCGGCCPSVLPDLLLLLLPSESCIHQGPCEGWGRGGGE